MTDFLSTNILRFEAGGLRFQAGVKYCTLGGEFDSLIQLPLMRLHTISRNLTAN